jgi:peptidoglycan/LPS O-acetylase OafA/YrhL
MAADRVSSRGGAAGGRIEIVEQLRGFAALFVAWFHFTTGNPGFLDDGPLRWSGKHAWVGVEVFFVISGFIIPWTMYQRRYRVSRHFFRFLLKRLLRLEPPYIAAIVLSVLLAYVSAALPGFRGQAPSYDWIQLLLHVGYLVQIAGRDWVNPAFWSLAIEFQFYVGIALVFPVLANRLAWVRRTSLAVVFLGSFLPLSDALIFPYLGVFALGMVTFHFRTGWMTTNAYLAASLLMAGAIGTIDSAVVGVFSLAAAWSIAFVGGPGLRPLAWLGLVSYSLYLLHVPIGGRIINLAERAQVGPFSRVSFLVVALAVSCTAAWLYYRFWEHPFQRWSARLKYSSPAA